jgi:hypothetical protein
MACLFGHLCIYKQLHFPTESTEQALKILEFLSNQFVLSVHFSHLRPQQQNNFQVSPLHTYSLGRVCVCVCVCVCVSHPVLLSAHLGGSPLASWGLCCNFFWQRAHTVGLDWSASFRAQSLLPALPLCSESFILNFSALIADYS